MIRPVQVYNLFFSSYKHFNRFIRARTGWTPIDTTLFQLAFKHKSLYPELHQNNERLELLGDAILASVVTHYLYRKYPHESEGFLTKMKSRIVSRSQLNKIAYRLTLKKYVQADLKEKELRKNAVLGNTLEALVGAIYLDGGYAAAKQFIENRLLEKILNIRYIENNDENFKSRLVEQGQQEGKSISFELLHETKVKKQKYFTCGAFVNDQLMAKGSAFSKKEAEQIAARQTLEQWE